MEVFQLVLKKMTRVFVKGESQMETLSMTTAAEQQTVKWTLILLSLLNFWMILETSKYLFFTAIANTFNSGKNCLKADGRKFNVCLSIDS